MPLAMTIALGEIAIEWRGMKATEGNAMANID